MVYHCAETMSEAKRQKVLKKVRSKYRRYLNSRKFIRYVRGMMERPAWWDLPKVFHYYQTAHAPLKRGGLLLCEVGEFRIGLVLMRNTMLGDAKAVAPALVLASPDVSPHGLGELFLVAKRINEYQTHADPNIRAAANQIYQDEEFQMLRQRALPPELQAPSYICLHDEMMRGSDFFEHTFGNETVPSPWTLLLATYPGERDFSAVIPGDIGLPVLEMLEAEAQAS